MSVHTPIDTAAADPVAPSFDPAPWLEAMRHVAQHYRLPMSEHSAMQASHWDSATDTRDRLRNLGRTVGLQIKFARREEFKATVSGWRLPLIIRFLDGSVGVLAGVGADGEAAVLLSGDQGLASHAPIALVLEWADLILIPRPARSIPDARVDDYIEPVEENWLRKIILRDLRPYSHVLIASLVANLLGLAGILFSTQVYDRVIPAQSFPTLWILYGGVLLAIGFDFLLRSVRMNVIDLLGKRADLRLSDRVFGHAMHVSNRARPKSTGTFIAQLRDLENVRELLTSTTVTAMVDIPFFLLFLLIFWLLVGPLVLVPLCAIVLLIVPSLLAQRKLRTHAQEAMREASLRNALLVEVVQGMEDIKSLQAEARFQQQWNHFNAVTGDAHIRGRTVTNRLQVWAHNIQNASYASVILCGAPMVMAGDITTGTLVGASILGSRMMAPMAQITQVMNRLQQARLGMKSLNAIMAMPVDYPERESRIHKSAILGRYAMKDALFTYDDDASTPALRVRDLKIEPGDRIAVLGRNGAGKSTLLQALSGMLEPAAGLVTLDDVALGQIDPGDVRRDVSLLSQNARLFHATLRDNIRLGAPHASEEEMLQVLAMVGASDFVSHLANGLDYQVLEGGRGLSGGQVQALLLARMLIRRPSVLLLDEPTASMDEGSERHFIRAFDSWSAGRTVVIATHRMRVLDLANRVIVVDQGQVVLDDEKSRALEKLKGRARPVVVKA